MVYIRDFNMNFVDCSTLPPIVDSFGRTIGNIRISLTDRCNFRCLYCMPTDPEFTPKESLLTFEEIVRLVEIFHCTGIHRFRLTGGEPTVRKDLPKLVGMIKNICPKISLAMTTNGVLLTQLANPLRQAGLEKLNISLDSLNKQTFEHLTQRKHFDDVMQGIDAAIHEGFKVKINAVAIRGITDAELSQFVEFAAIKNVEVRFIELMPFNGNEDFQDHFISKKELVDLLTKQFPVKPIKKEDPSQTSVSYRVGNALIGFIPSVTESFCHTCNRIRITANGQLRPCLHSPLETDLLKLLRKNATDNDLYRAINETVAKKWKGHPDFTLATYRPPLSDRAMMLIGG